MLRDFPELAISLAYRAYESICRQRLSSEWATAQVALTRQDERLVTAYDQAALILETAQSTSRPASQTTVTVPDSVQKPVCV